MTPPVGYCLIVAGMGGLNASLFYVAMTNENYIGAIFSGLALMFINGLVRKIKARQ